ncbi:MAG: Na/Pi symporter, partial [Rhodoferax sp.]|nr:Na/Pi symporter [Rhodoferax sp.]
MNDSPATLLGEIFAGLGLFFVGIKLIGGNLQQMTSRTVRDRLRRAVDTPVRGALLGIVAGALTQSTNAVTFIMTSMSAAGLLTIARAAPVVIWANVGTSALVLVATVDLRLPLFYVLGLIGLLYFFDVEKSDRFRHPAAALLGLALLFLGLLLIKSGAAPLKEMQAVRTLLEMAATSYGLVFLVGMSITLVVQSSVTVSTIAVAMVHSGLLSMEQTALVMYGSGLGAAISLWFMTANLHGSARQLAYLQILQKFIATALLLALFVLEHLLQRSYLLATLAHFSSQAALQAALVFLVYQCVGAVAMTASRTAMLRRIARWAPANHEETLATPHYLYEQALDDVHSALDLVGKEQARLVSMLPRYVCAAELRNPSPAVGAGLSVQVLYRVNREVRQQVEQFLTDLMNSNSDRQAR